MKVAVLGAGGMGESVITILREIDTVKGITAYDIKGERIKELQEKHKIEGATDLNAVLNDREITLVFVTASNDAHKELATRSMEAGKAVLCEKPIATTLDDARKVVEVSEREKVFLQVGFELRYSKLYTKTKDWIDAGLLGDVVNTHCYYISSEFHYKGSWRNKESTGGSMFGEKLCHYVDLPRWWVGSEVTDVISTCAPNVIPYYEVHDNYHTTYRFKNGAVGHITFMMAPGTAFEGDPLQNVVSQQKGDGHHLRFLVVGTKGCVETDVFARTMNRWEFIDTPKCLKSDWVEKLTWDEKEDSVYFHNGVDQTKDIVRRVAEGLPPKTSARDAYETMKLVFAAEKSANNGGQMVSLSQL